MAKSLEKQLTMCDMLPDDQAHANCSDRQQDCLTRNLCNALPVDNNLYSFVEWQKNNQDLLSRSIQGHHQSNV